MFAVGDKVRYKSSIHHAVTGDRRHLINEVGVYTGNDQVRWPDGSLMSHTLTWLELVPDEATDEELAATYRQFRTTGMVAYEELVARGYVITLDGVIPNSRFGSKSVVTIKKTTTTVKEL